MLIARTARCDRRAQFPYELGPLPFDVCSDDPEVHPCGLLATLGSRKTQHLSLVWQHQPPLRCALAALHARVKDGHLQMLYGVAGQGPQAPYCVLPKLLVHLQQLCMPFELVSQPVSTCLHAFLASMPLYNPHAIALRRTTGETQ